MFSRLCAHETLLQKHFCFQETKYVFDFFQKHFVATEIDSPFVSRKQCWIDSRVHRLHFLNWACTNVFFSVPCLLLCTARKHCFPLVCTPSQETKILRSSVPLFAAAFILNKVLSIWILSTLIRHLGSLSSVNKINKLTINLPANKLIKSF